VGEQRIFEEVRSRPPSQQRKLIEMVDAVVQQYKRKEAG